MFTTPPSAEVPLPGIFRDGFRQWRVSLHSNFPWLHVTLTTVGTDELGDRSDYMMVDDPHTLSHVISGLEADQRIHDVQVVTPPWLNMAKVWRMDPVDSLSIAKHEEGYDVHIFELASGGSYRLGIGGKDCQKLLPSRDVIYESVSKAARGAF